MKQQKLFLMKLDGGMRQGTLFRLLILLTVSCLGDGQSQRVRFCEALFRCLDTSLLCPVLFSYYNCSELPPPFIDEPACGESSVTGPASVYAMPRVVGGIDAEEREFPWTVHVTNANGRSNLCGGTIINKEAVITAAHCISSLVNRPRSVEVGYGSTNISRLTYIKARSVVIHPGYNRINSDNDIGVILLSEPLPLSDSTNLRSACLPQRGRTDPRAPECVVTGWGLLQDGGSILTDMLQKAAVPLVDRDICQRSYDSIPNIFVSDRQLCAGYFNEGGIDACHGDSGGPLVCPDGDQWVLYGVVSIGNGCARAGFPGVYASVPQHIDWIEAQIYQR